MEEKKQKRLQLGVAYHGNRMLKHVREDMSDIAAHGMDTVVHMFSHTDWTRQKTVMKDILSVSEEAGLEVWVDNWGLAGSPGDPSHFLAYNPDSRRYYSNGEPDRATVCWNSPDYLAFTKEWADTVYEIGGRSIFWDEPCLPEKTKDKKRYYTCACRRCQRLFEERYGKTMPETADEDTRSFAADSIVEYYRKITEYTHNRGMKNIMCVMPDSTGIGLDNIYRICSLEHLDNIGCDPYWTGLKELKPSMSVYDYVYQKTRTNLEMTERFHKEHNVWIQTFANPRGEEEDIIEAAEAAYDAGARTILAWGYYGSESHDYRAANPAVVWARTCEAMERVRNMERDRLLFRNRQIYGK